MLSWVLMFFICITCINIACGRECLPAWMLNRECMRIRSPAYMAVQVWVGGRCCSSLKGAEVGLREHGSGCQKSLFNDTGTVLLLCLGPWDSVSLINKLLICTMCLQHCWGRRRVTRKCVVFGLEYRLIILGATVLSPNCHGILSSSTLWIFKDILTQCCDLHLKKYLCF